MVLRREWTEEDDKKLRRLVRDSIDWAAISNEFDPKRSPGACKQRWYSVLSKRPDNSNPDGQKGGSGQELGVVGGNNKMLRLRWTAAEDKKLQDLEAEFGDNWEYIGSKMKRRTPGACKSRWNNVLSKRLANHNPDVPVNDHNNPGGGGGGGEEAQEVGTGNENDNTGGGGGGGGGEGEAQELATGNEKELIFAAQEGQKELERLIGLTWKDTRSSFETVLENENDNPGGGGGGEAQEQGTRSGNDNLVGSKEQPAGDANDSLGERRGA